VASASPRVLARCRLRCPAGGVLDLSGLPVAFQTAGEAMLRSIHSCIRSPGGRPRDESCPRPGSLILAVLFLIFLLPIVTARGHGPAFARAYKLEDLGVPVRKAALLAWTVGPDGRGEMARLYFSFAQKGAPFFLVQADPATGAWEQFGAPAGAGAWGLAVGPEGRIYLGTYYEGYIMRFDPARPGKGIELVGRPAESEKYIWSFTVGKDGKLYGGTYPNAKLVSLDPGTGEMSDLGRLDRVEKYCRYVATGEEGWIYAGIGTARGDIVAYDPRTGEHKSALPEAPGIATQAKVWNGRDGRAYGRIGKHVYRLLGGRAEEVSPDGAAEEARRSLSDGRILRSASRNGWYELYDPHTRGRQKGTFEYEGAGVDVFVLGAGPGGVVFGSSAMPLELFSFDPRSDSMVDIGRPTPADGEVYSLASTRGKLYLAAYPGGWFSVYDPSRPWSYGATPDHNPYVFGKLGDGLYRPRAIAVGGDGRIYVGGIPASGRLGGSLAIYDPAGNELLGVYRGIVPRQSIVSLVWEPSSGLLFGGSSVVGGSGVRETERSGHIFAWDPYRGEKVLDFVPEEGQRAVVSLAQAGGKVFAVLSGSSELSPELVAYDVSAGTITCRKPIELGTPVANSLQAWRDGMVYGLTERSVFAVDPGSCEIETVFSTRSFRITCGMAVLDSGIYFGSGIRLMRLAWR